jgi:hypothetical protein
LASEPYSLCQTPMERSRDLERENPAPGFRTSLRGVMAAALVLGTAFVLAACGGASTGDAPETSASETSASEATVAETPASEKTGAAAAGPDEAAELARAEVGRKEITNMMPADGKKPDPPRPLPDDPPAGIEVYPATTNRTTREPIDYEREPPTNGDHDPLWQNCGFYERPVKDRHAVHSMDHGVVWITYRPDLPTGQVDELRSYGEESYVIVSPYPGQDAPVVATSWRVQLELDGPEDPRLRRFVDQFRISEIAPLSGNRCTGGVGNPKV